MHAGYFTANRVPCTVNFLASKWRDRQLCAVCCCRGECNEWTHLIRLAPQVDSLNTHPISALVAPPPPFPLELPLSVAFSLAFECESKPKHNNKSFCCISRAQKFVRYHTEKKRRKRRTENQNKNQTENTVRRRPRRRSNALSLLQAILHNKRSDLRKSLRIFSCECVLGKGIASNEK